MSRRPTGHPGRLRSRESGDARSDWQREESMKKSGGNPDRSASELISKRIADLGDWRGETLGRMRRLIREAAPDVVEEWKWAKATSPGTPVWSDGGIICTGESYKSVVK